MFAKVVCLLVFLLAATVQLAAKELKVLMIGNSFSRCVGVYLPRLVNAENKHHLILTSAYIGGCPLHKHHAKLLEAEKEYLSDFVIVETPIGSFSVNRHMVSLISMENRKLYLYLDQGQKMQTLNLRLRDVPEVLGSSFVQINKSEYVNTEHIRVFDQNKLVLINGIEVFVSRRKEKEVQNAYFRRFL